jgi:DNA polymerase-3 subunit delta
MNKNEPYYVLLGPEVGQKNSFLDEIRLAMTKSFGEKPEEHRLYSFDTPIEEALGILRNASLFSASRLVLYNGVEDIKKKDEIQSLLGYFKKPSPEGVLVLLSEKISADKKILDAAGSRKKIFWELFENQKRDWVLGFFGREKIRIGSDAADLILELVENNTRDLERECRNLCFFYGDQGEVTAENVESFLFHGKQETVFSLFEQVSALDLETSVDILHKILLEGESQPVGILAGLLWQFRNLQALSQLLGENYPLQEAYGKLRIMSKRNQKTYGDAVKKFSARELEDIIVLFADFDEELRSTRGDLQTRLLEIFLYSVIVRKGGNFLRKP